MADGVPSVLVIVDGDQKYPTVIGPSVIMKYLVVNMVATGPLFCRRGRRERGQASCMSDTRHATAIVSLDYNWPFVFRIAGRECL